VVISSLACSTDTISNLDEVPVGERHHNSLTDRVAAEGKPKHRPKERQLFI
jgi:hypothetical protein